MEPDLSSGNNLTRTEFANITEKVNAGAIGTALMRFPIFQPVERVSARGQLPVPLKFVYSGTTITVDYNLSQKHLNALTVMFETPDKKLHSGGRLVISTSLYSLAKKMGYKNADGPVALKNLIDDMVKVTMTIQTPDNKKYNFHLIDSYVEDLKSGGHVFNLSPEFMRFFAYDFAVQIERARSAQLVKHRISAVQSVIRYFVTNSATLKNGVYLDTIAAHYGRDKTKDMKSKFKTKIKNNLDFLEKYNIRYDTETEKFFYTPSADVAQIFRPVETPNTRLLSLYKKFSQLTNTEIPYSNIFNDRPTPITIQDSSIDDYVELSLQDGNGEDFQMQFEIQGDRVEFLAGLYDMLTGTTKDDN